MADLSYLLYERGGVPVTTPVPFRIIVVSEFKQHAYFCKAKSDTTKGSLMYYRSVHMRRGCHHLGFEDTLTQITQIRLRPSNRDKAEEAAGWQEGFDFHDSMCSHLPRFRQPLCGALQRLSQYRESLKANNGRESYIRLHIGEIYSDHTINHYSYGTPAIFLIPDPRYDIGILNLFPSRRAQPRDRLADRRAQSLLLLDDLHPPRQAPLLWTVSSQVVLAVSCPLRAS